MCPMVPHACISSVMLSVLVVTGPQWSHHWRPPPRVTGPAPPRATPPLLEIEQCTSYIMVLHQLPERIPFTILVMQEISVLIHSMARNYPQMSCF